MYCSIANISNWCTCSSQGPCDETILRYLIYRKGALVANSLTIFNQVIMPIVNVVNTLLKP